MLEIPMRSPMLIAMLALAGCPKAAPEETVEVKLCDNHTTAEVPADSPKTEEFGRAVAATLMEKWQQQNPEVDWEADERASRPFNKPADNSALLAEQTQAGDHPYRTYTEQDILTWSRETEKLAVAGSRVFHSADELGSTIAVSCDMCHPHAANTHPETYPKFQTQIGQVALLRDMINWCLIHPVRADPMDADDPRMRAMEAYIISQRMGVPLEYGKH
jgi:thiosulfate dehydrogenase